jgi:hypothetical protein
MSESIADGRVLGGSLLLDLLLAAPRTRRNEPAWRGTRE